MSYTPPHRVERWIGRDLGTLALALTPERLDQVRAAGIDLAAAVASLETFYALGAASDPETASFIVTLAWIAAGGYESADGTLLIGGRRLTLDEFAQVLARARTMPAPNPFTLAAEAAYLAVLAVYPSSPAATALGLDPKKWKRRDRS